MRHAFALCTLVLPCLLVTSCGGGGRGGSGVSDGGAGGGHDASAVVLGDMRGQGCALGTFEAQQAPAAMLVLLDRSSSMDLDNKWTFAANAIVQAVDQDIFDTMYVGLLSAPSGTVNGPACVFGFPVACKAPAFPDIDLTLAGALKSTAPTGVRHVMKDWLRKNNPDNGLGDASPLYAAIQSSILALQGWPQKGKRILFVVTDGTISCNEFSNRPGYPDANGCTHDWENPNNIVALLQQANQDLNAPIESFIVGVPGADTYDQSGTNYPPYHMRAALSAIAYAGSPSNVPANCTGKAFMQNTPDPAVSCHIDLTQKNFSAAALSDAISQVRGKVLGCTFDLPQPDGGVLDKDQVNVTYTVGDMQLDLFRRKDPTNDCLQTGCWDYDGDNKVKLIGKACEDVRSGTNVKVEITVGCATIIG